MLKRWLKGVAIFILLVITLVTGFLFYLHTDSGKSLVRKKVESFLQKKWETNVSVGKIDYRLPNWIALEKLVIWDRKHDTLLHGRRIYVAINLLKLLSNKVEVAGLALEDINLRCRREATDSVFNFQFVLNAFAPSGKKTKKDSTGTPLQLSVSSLSVKRFQLRLQDDYRRSFLSVSLDELLLRPTLLQPEKNTFKVNDLTLRGTQVIMIDSSARENSPTEQQKESHPSNLLLAVNQLKLSRVSFSYQQPHTKTAYRFRVDSLHVQTASADFNQQRIKANSIWLSQSDVALQNHQPVNNQSTVKPPNETISHSARWVVDVASVAFRNNAFAYSNSAFPEKAGLDLRHIRLKKIHLQLRKNHLDTAGFFSEVAAFSALYNEKIYLRQVTATVSLLNQVLHLQNPSAAINRSNLKTSGEFVMPFQQEIKPVDAKLVIQNSMINYGDLLLVLPDLRKSLPVSLQPADNIMLSCRLSGSMQQLRAEELKLSTSDQCLSLTGSADVRAGAAGTKLNAVIQRLQLRKKLLSKTWQQQLRKQGINLPDEVVLSGSVQADAQSVLAKIVMKSTFGLISVDGRVANFSKPENLAYRVLFKANNFATGKWIGLDSVLGPITGRILIHGTGTNVNRLVTTANLQLTSAVIRGYSLSNVALQTTFNRSQFRMVSAIHDRNLETALHVNGRIGKDFAVEGAVNIQKADLFHLGLTQDHLVYAGNITMSAGYQYPGLLAASIRARNNQILINEKIIEEDEVLATCRASADSTIMEVTAPFFAVRLAGNYPLDALSAELSTLQQQLLLFNARKTEVKLETEKAHHSTFFSANISEDSLIHFVLPGLELKQPVLVQGWFERYRPDTSLLIHVQAPDLSYKNFGFRDLKTLVVSSDTGLQVALNTKQFFNGQKLLGEAVVKSYMERNFLSAKVTLTDSAGKEFYAAGIDVNKQNDETAIRLPDDLLLNYNRWKVSSDNLVRVVKDGFVINNLALKSRGQTVLISTKDQHQLSPVDIRIDSFDLANISTVLSPGDTVGVRGMLSADISIQQPVQKIPVATGDIRLSGLDVFDVPLGDLRFHSANMADSLVVNGELDGNVQLAFAGGMHLRNGGIDLQTRLAKFNTHLVEPWTKTFLNRLSGQLSGDMQVKGKLDSLRYHGAVSFDSVAFVLKALNTPYRIQGQKIFLDDPLLRFQNFALLDSAGHPLTIDGDIGLFAPDERPIRLAIETKDFSLLHTTRQSGASLYGNGIIDANMNVIGTVHQPVIKGSIHLQSKSDVRFVNTPKKSPVRSKKDGIVFVKMDTLDLAEQAFVALQTDSIQQGRREKNLNYELAMTVDKDATLTISVNPSTGDELVLKGDARLNVGMGKNGAIGLEGVYNLQSGSYKMNNLLFRGKFVLVKGSSISFSGDPQLAEADVTTEYLLEASPKGLLNYKETDNSGYSQRVPFAVILMMKGTLTKPVLSFDIQLRPGKTLLKSSEKSDIEHALERLRTDLTEMNKQVFSLLLTKRFASIEDVNTLESSNLNANNALKEGVSSFLTQAMDQVADQLIKNVDVDVSMKTYKTADDPVSKTDLGVAMSKDLLEDRLVIRVEENFAMGDQSAYPVKSGSQYIPDITSTYKLTKDGRFQLKAYQKNEYDAVVQGYFTEVGVSFTIELSYDTFKELKKRRKAGSNETK